MNRRDTVVVLLALAATAKPASSFAQSRPGRSVRVGMLFVSEGNATLFQPFPELLRELGWVEGKNLVFARRIADGRPTELPRLASELVQLNPDVIVVPSNFEAEAVLRATRTIPVVVAAASDPVETGLAQSLAHPGGSVTGLVWSESRRSAKVMEVMHESVPTMRRLAGLYDERFPGIQLYAEAFQVAANAIGFEMRRFPVRSPEDIAAALTSMEKEGVDALWVVPGGVLAPEIARILTYATERRLPTGFPNPWPVERGGLLSFGPNPSDMLRRVAGIVDKILRGANPADLPFEYPTRYELTLNLKTAKALGIKFPQTVLLRADRLIE
jgi:putative ABC transport system substrate-binding protein